MYAGMGMYPGNMMMTAHMMSGAMMYGGRGQMAGFMFPSFESLDEVLKKLNAKLKEEPIPGICKIFPIDCIQ